MPFSAIDAIGPAFEHVRDQLLRRFRFGQWVRLAIVGLLAGEMGSSGSCNANVNLPGGKIPWPVHPQNVPHTANAFLPEPWTSHPILFGSGIAVLIAAGLVLLVLLIYVSSVMRFILFDSIVAKECHIRAGWTRRKRPGFDLFVWWILFIVASWAAILLLIGGPVAYAWALGWFVHPGEDVLRLVLGGLALLLVLLVFAVVAVVIQVMTKDFVVPQMALEGINAFEGWRRLWLWLKHDAGGYVGYVGMKIVLSIGASIAFAIVTGIAILVLLIPLGGAGLVAVLYGKAAGWTWNLHTIALAVVLGIIALAILMFVAALIAVPIVVFFPAYSLYFFAPRYAQLAALLWPAPPPTPPTPVAPA
ncbi:MAG: hypothetical protein WBX16_14040 [Candidatus Acidiferrales bacterium]